MLHRSPRPTVWGSVQGRAGVRWELRGWDVDRGTSLRNPLARVYAVAPPVRGVSRNAGPAPSRSAGVP